VLKDQNTKERIVDIAENFIMRRGYNGFSYKDISSELNVKNAAIHYHFPTKKDLGVAVIQRGQTRFKEWDAMLSNQEISPVDMLELSLEIYISYLESEECICLGGSLETDFNTLPEEMRSEVKKFFSGILTWMRNLLSRGREVGVFTFSGPSEDKALFILSSIQGALQIARVSDKELFYRVVAKVKSELGL
jgi:TetR/AcrR family transcriptional regulator, transcriptional repressor for nem operon